MTDQLLKTIDGKYVYTDANNWCDGEKTSDSMITVMGEQRIFSIKIATEKNWPKPFLPGIKEGEVYFQIEEGCDNYFETYITPEQLYQLGKELIELSGV